MEEEKHHKEEHSKEEHKEESRKEKRHYSNIIIGLIALLGIVLIIDIVLTFNLNQEIKKSAKAINEKLKPAKIGLTVIKNSKCNECFDISAFVSQLKKLNVNITKEALLEFDSKEGKEVLNNYKIEKVPTFIVTGEIDKVNIELEQLEKRENALFFKPEPPYTNAKNGEIEGKVILYYLKDNSCKKCSDLTALINSVKSTKIMISKEKNVDINSEEGRELTKKYKIGFVPTIILSKDAGVYEIIQQAWSQIGTKESDAYVMRLVRPPFINLTNGKLSGVVDIIYLADKSCIGCYNVSFHKEILTSPQSFGITLDKEEIIDISSTKGKELTAKYNITQVPTIILSSEISVYPITRELKQFFSVEKDSSYVFRRVFDVGTYKDLKTDQVVKQSEGQ